MYDVVTFGSATRDILVKPKTAVARDGFCLPVGAKVEIDNLVLSSGGGGTNTAATFAKQGFFTAFCGMVGDDLAGAAIIEELKKLGVGAGMVKKNANKATNHSIVLAPEGIDRTILVWRGASDFLQKKDIPWQAIKESRWFYLAPFAKTLSNMTGTLINFAHKNKIKIAMNPGYDQLSFPEKKIAGMLKKVDVLIINREEAGKLTGINHQNEEDIFRKLDEMAGGIVIMTKGKEGAVASDGQYLYRAPILEKKVVDRTGAGDSFGSGFVAGLIHEKGNIEKALQLAVANSAFCLSKSGAKEGLLIKGQKYARVKIGRQQCQGTKYCKIK
ncbi:MAG: carbohydrate kinase family protein [Candidatus Nealsonbacteria bacterium]|nr:carbohydrate kinase family protein [Candidatus Nealsonbacteria bacterium]